MRRKRKRPDIASAGKSAVVPFKEDESWGLRHMRRLITNLSYEKEVADWAEAHGWLLQIKNNGHHWIFTRHDKYTKSGIQVTWVEWWPSSAKMVIDKQWSKGVHVHDYKQLIREFETRKKLRGK